MSITTKTGDKGTTGIFTGERIVKFSPIIEANGTIDELSSFLGEAKHYVDDELKEILEKIQVELYSLMAEIASKGEYKKVGEKEISHLEELIRKFEEDVKLEGFVIPGSTLASAKLDVCRAVARRAERKVSKVVLEYGIAEDALKYLNRLSDLLFVMARYIELKEGKIKYAK
ncbi:cob(I)yrinic acid a,c-diamide adenosyltransferase [Thermococcus sibiricus]|uniref:Cobalamin adenosyltransferase n=2 Tax=Thermococcus sibiricus TaxID=172049 RepID=C6A1W2_THESM|nr:cob(I)yrinic acid a,c-diamide adenosyltransferase [Thermococcus sibiricus]ACS89607.1 Cobalamin adenosyltransferase [Thermococcus sibiricus MM 739]KUK17341.1 MAG: Cobalamin adenosyltransferase [Thermococcus sibiricus]KUK27833.1 MAG: Cobalamin adenosyltransferase [Thermococcus sp. 40_45]